MNAEPAANPPQRPPSPWLRKFGSLDETVIHSVQSSLRHSGLAPMCPPLDPTHYADSVASDPIPRPTDHELDVLFGTERAQIDANLGLTTWEIGTLHEHLINGWPGGHRSTDPPMPRILEQGYGVDVDEDIWHPVFARGKWYDFRVPILDQNFLPDGLEGIAPDDVWSVDVPRVWKELRVPLELANRWLRHMAKGRWLNHLVHEDREEWMQATPRPSFVPPPGYIPSPGAANQEQFEPSLGPNGRPWRIPARGRVTDYDSDVTLMEIATRLRSKHIWTFIDDGHHTKDGDNYDELYGRTARRYNRGEEEPREGTPHTKRARPFIVTYIHVSPLRVLLNPASTLSEKCHAIWCLAMTILHELVHAINVATHDSWRDMGFEPYYGNEWAAELGSSAIKSFFGGDISEAPKIDTPGKPGPKYGLATVDFPAPPGVESVIAVNNDPVVHLGQVTHSYPLPTAWVSSTLLQSFYETIAQRYGLAAFQAPKLFASRKIWRGFYSRVHRAQPLPSPPSLVDPSTAADPGLYQPLRDTHNALLARRRLYDRIRPWYPFEYYRWQLTPYANVACRAIIERFSAAVQRSARIADSHVAEREGAQAILGISYWLTDRQMRPGLDQPWPRTMWFYSVLTLMMRAVLPGRRTTVGRDHTFRVAKNVWFPSQACVRAGNNRWEFPETRQVYQGYSRMYYMYARHTGGVNNRIWLLEQARSLMRAHMPVNPVPALLAHALEWELQRLLQEAAFEVENEEWLDWQFELPPYGTDFATVHEEAQGVFLVPWQGFPGGWPQPDDQDFELSPRAPPMIQAMAARVVPEGQRVPGRRGTRRPTTYFTVSEVGEMMSDDRTGPNWALLRDGHGGYDVYDLSDILTEDPTIDLKTALEWTSLGRVIVSREIIAAIQADDQNPLGKLLTWRHLQEVQEHDGQDGRDLWCVIGPFIYDITNFPFHSDKEKQALIALTTADEPQGEALDTLNMPGLFKRLAPYICGFIRQSAPSAPARERIFTRVELKRYIYPEIGMYCEIDGDVYDLGRYLQSHPGGAEILRQYAGTDATEAFWKAHGDWARTLNTHSALRVGRIVEGRSPSQRLEDQEIVLFDEVFLIWELIADHEALYDDLQPFGGTNATQALKEGDAPGALRRLLSMKHLVCAKVVPRWRITDAELQKHNRLPDKSERCKRPQADDTNWRAWVSVAEMSGVSMLDGVRKVYDVTIPMMFGPAELEEKLRPWLGKEVEDEELIARLETHYTGFIIGEIVRPESAADMGQWHVAGAGRKAQILGSRHRQGRQNLGGSKRRASAQDNDDPETARRSKRSRLRSGR